MLFVFLDRRDPVLKELYLLMGYCGFNTKIVEESNLGNMTRGNVVVMKKADKKCCRKGSRRRFTVCKHNEHIAIGYADGMKIDATARKDLVSKIRGIVKRQRTPADKRQATLCLSLNVLDELV